MGRRHDLRNTCATIGAMSRLATSNALALSCLLGACEPSGSAPASPQPLRSAPVGELRVGTAAPATVYPVLLDDEGRRVVPKGRRLAYDLQLTPPRKGEIVIDDSVHRDGILQLELPKSQRPRPCELHIFVRFHIGTELLEDWVDDWMYEC